MSLRLLVVGHGRMGRLVEGLAGEYGMEVAGRVDRSNARDVETLCAALQQFRALGGRP